MEHVAHWARTHPLEPIHVDCVTAVKLKILDGKCKMNPDEKIIMARLYEHTKYLPGKLLGDDVHHMIAAAGDSPAEEMIELIYEKRVLAETMISRPIMKGFKAMIRQLGLFNGVQAP